MSDTLVIRPAPWMRVAVVVGGLAVAGVFTQLVLRGGPPTAWTWVVLALSAGWVVVVAVVLAAQVVRAGPTRLRCGPVPARRFPRERITGFTVLAWERFQVQLVYVELDSGLRRPLFATVGLPSRFNDAQGYAALLEEWRAGG